MREKLQALRFALLGALILGLAACVPDPGGLESADQLLDLAADRTLPDLSDAGVIDSMADKQQTDADSDGRDLTTPAPDSVADLLLADKSALDLVATQDAVDDALISDTASVSDALQLDKLSFDALDLASNDAGSDGAADLQDSAAVDLFDAGVADLADTLTVDLGGDAADIPQDTVGDDSGPLCDDDPTGVATYNDPGIAELDDHKAFQLLVFCPTGAIAMSADWYKFKVTAASEHIFEVWYQEMVPDASVQIAFFKPAVNGTVDPGIPLHSTSVIDFSFAGFHTVRLNVGILQPGTYYLRLRASRSPILKTKLIYSLNTFRTCLNDLTCVLETATKDTCIDVPELFSQKCFDLK